MSENVDLYHILGVSRNCSMEEMKKSYKKLCIQHHPDKGGDENEFKKVSEAYNILKDPEKKEIYDKFGFDGLKNGMGQNTSDVHSMMENLFGFGFGGRQQAQERVPAPMFIPLRVPLEDVVNGNMDYIYKLQRKIVDRTKERKQCSLCQGNGFRVMNRQMGFMQMQQQVECPQCKGAKYENANELFQTIEEKVVVPIPKNCTEQHRFVLKNKQDERIDGESGDVVLVIEYKDHPTFQRKGPSLYLTLALTFMESLTGFTRNIELLDRSFIEVRYPYLVKWNELLVLPQKGLYNAFTHQHGDLHIGFDIAYPTPTSLDKSWIEKISAAIVEKDQQTSIEIKPSNMFSKKMEYFTPSDPTKSSQKQAHPGNEGQARAAPPGHGIPFPMPGMGGGIPGMPGGGAMECNQQ